MNLTNLLVTNLLTMSNLTFFLDRLITDGKYKTVLLNFNDAHLNGHSLFSLMVNAADGKYAIVSTKIRFGTLYAALPFPKRPDLLRIFTLELSLNGDDEPDLYRFKVENEINVCAHNIVLLIPFVQKRKLWDTIKADLFPYKDISVVFYGTEESMFHPIEIYALNYKLSGERYFMGFEIDEESSLYRGQLNEADLHGKIFGLISKKPNVHLYTDTGVDKYLLKASVLRGNESVINLGCTDYYLSNFIAHNLRFKDTWVQQTLLNKQIAIENASFNIQVNYYYHNVSTEKIYTEIYSEMPQLNEVIYRFVIIAIIRANRIERDF